MVSVILAKKARPVASESLVAVSQGIIRVILAFSGLPFVKSPCGVSNFLINRELIEKTNFYK